MKKKKPRIIILLHYLELGGVEISLIGLLNALDPKQVDVDLFIYSHQGPLMKYVPSWVNLLPEIKSYSMIERSLVQALKSKEFGVVTGRILAKLKHRRYRKHLDESLHSDIEDYSIFQYVGYNVSPFLPKINPNVEYDLCISFLGPHNIAKDKVNAKKKIAWIHTDYSTVHVNTNLELPVWNSFDYIASISDSVTEAFLKSFPSLKSKVIKIENILATFFVQKRALAEQISLSGSPKLLSIGRFTYQKNFDNIPDVARKIVESGYPELKWYIIGFGGDEDLIRKKIKEANVENHVILLGKKENPYPYIKECDIYIQPSRYEGKSVTVREAQMLCKPVIITNYPTAQSQVEDGVNGIIVPMDNEGCAREIVDILMNPPLQRILIENCKSQDFSNQSEINKIYSFLL